MFGWALKMRPAANKFLRRSRCQRDILKTSNPVPRAEFSLSCSRTAVPEQFTAELSSAIVVDIIDESDGNRFVPIKGPATPCSEPDQWDSVLSRARGTIYRGTECISSNALLSLLEVGPDPVTRRRSCFRTPPWKSPLLRCNRLSMWSRNRARVLWRARWHRECAGAGKPSGGFLEGPNAARFWRPARRSNHRHERS